MGKLGILGSLGILGMVGRLGALGILGLMGRLGALGILGRLGILGPMTLGLFPLPFCFCAANIAKKKKNTRLPLGIGGWVSFFITQS